MKQKNTNKAEVAPAIAGNACDHPRLDGFASAMARHPEKWYWCRDCKQWVNGKGEKYSNPAPAQSGQHTPLEYELLEALKDCVGFLKDMSDDYEDYGVKDMYNKARAAIAKAEGK